MALLYVVAVLGLAAPLLQAEAAVTKKPDHSADPDNSFLAHVKLTRINNTKGLQLTIVPLDTNSTSFEISKRNVYSDDIPVVVDGEVRHDLRKKRDVRRREPMAITVERDVGFNDSIPVIVDGEVRLDLRKRNLAYYITPEQSSIAVETERRRRFIEGEFFERGKRYTITPVFRERRGDFHLITEKRAAARNTITGQLFNGGPSQIKAGPAKARPSGRTKRAADDENYRVGPYYLELAVFTDVSIYKYYRRQDRSASKEDVIKNIHHRVGHLIHGVDLAYRRMRHIDLSVWLTQLYVSTKFSSSRAVTINALENRTCWNAADPTTCKADADKIRENMNDWLDRQDFSADHAMGFTMYDLWQIEEDYDIVGFADWSNMCDPEAGHGSVVEWGSFHIWATVAHELAHNLDVAHDGDSTSSGCDSEHFYLMTTNSALHDSSTIDNAFRFSECSEYTILESILASDEGGYQCLEDRVSGHAVSVGSHLPGEEYSINQQCKLVYGDNSVPCVQEDNFAEICTILHCVPDETVSPVVCDTPGDFRAAMGTPCGNKKWCYEGKCVRHRNAKRYNPDTDPQEWYYLGD